MGVDSEKMSFDRDRGEDMFVYVALKRLQSWDGDKNTELIFTKGIVAQ